MNPPPARPGALARFAGWLARAAVVAVAVAGLGGAPAGLRAGPAWAGAAPAPARAPATLDVELDSQARASIRPPLVVAEGGVTARYGQTTIRARRLVYDDSRRVATFEEEVELRQPGRVLRGRRLTYELDADRATMEQALGEEQAPGLGVPVYLQAPKVQASGGVVAAEGAELTTCPLPLDHAHYVVRVRRLEVEVGRWVRAWHAVVVDNGVPIFYWPYLQFSLTNPRAGQFAPPEVGTGSREGWYVRGRLPYLGPGDRYGYLLVDYYEKLGPGLGVYQALHDDGRNLAAVMARWAQNRSGRVPDAELGLELSGQAAGGQASLRALAGQKDDQGAVQRELRLVSRAELAGWGLSWLVDGLARQTQPSGSLPEGAYLAGRLRLSPPAASSPWSWQAEGRWDVNTIDPDLPPRILWDLSGRVGWRPAGPSGRLELWLAASHVTHPDLFADPAGQWGRAELEWVAAERLPEVGLTYTAWQGNAGGVPLVHRWTVAAGWLREFQRSGSGSLPVGAGSLSAREDLRLSLQPSLELGPVAWGAVRVSGESSLLASAYGTGARQLAWTGSLRGERSWSSGRLAVDLRMVQPLGDAGQGGGSPFAFDRAQPEQMLTATATVGENRPVGAVVRAGYLLSEGRWKELAAQVEAGRGGPLSGGLFALYQPELGGWRWLVGWADMRAGTVETSLAGRVRLDSGTVDEVGARVRVPLGEGTDLQAGASYDLAGQRWLRYDLKLTWKVAPEWAVSARARFDRSLGGLQYGELAVSWDQDCRAVTVRFDPARQTVALAYQIRGFAQPVVGAFAPEGGELFRPEGWQAELTRLRGSW